MTSVLKPVTDRYNNKNPEERYLFRRLVRNFIKWYGYITQVVRMFDADMHKEYNFLRYLLHLLPAEKYDPVDLEGKLNWNTINCKRLSRARSRAKTLTASTSLQNRRAVQANKRKAHLTICSTESTDSTKVHSQMLIELFLVRCMTSC